MELKEENEQKMSRRKERKEIRKKERKALEKEKKERKNFFFSSSPLPRHYNGK